MFTPGNAGPGAARGLKWLGVATLAVAVPAAVVAVGPQRPAAGPGTVAPVAAHAAGHQGNDPASDPVAVPGPASQAAAPAAAPAAPELALEYQKLLGQHAVLTAELMRSRIRSEPDLAEAANAAVGKNTRDMAAVVASLAGPQAAKAFSSQWSTHVTALFNYARALAAKDRQAQAQTRTTLIAYEAKAGRGIAAGTGGALSPTEMSKALTVHVEQLMDSADAYAAGDYARSYALQREAHHHMFDLGRTMGAGYSKAGGRPTAGLDEPRWLLQSSLAQALSEHATLATEAMRARVTGGPDFPAAAASLEANTRDLAGTIGAVFGDPAGAKFQSLWADHLDQFIGYADAVRSGDTAAQAEAKQRLDTFQGAFARYLDNTTDGKLPAADLSAAFAEHDDMLLDQVDAYAAKKYAPAHDLAYEAYQDVFGMSGEFADAIAKVAGARLPRGGAQTGAGGMAGHLATGHSTAGHSTAGHGR
jgi:hypothetical protein